MKTFLLSMATVALFVLAVACAPASAPTAAPSAASDPASIVQSVHAAMNSGNLDAAMALIADDAFFKNAQPSGATLTGKDAIQGWVKHQIDTKTIGEVSDLKVNGDTVTFTAKATRNGAPLGGGPAAITVKNGKIVLWDFNAAAP